MVVDWCYGHSNSHCDNSNVQCDEQWKRGSIRVRGRGRMRGCCFNDDSGYRGRGRLRGIVTKVSIICLISAKHSNQGLHWLLLVCSFCVCVCVNICIYISIYIYISVSARGRIHMGTWGLFLHSLSPMALLILQPLGDLESQASPLDVSLLKSTLENMPGCQTLKFIRFLSILPFIDLKLSAKYQCPCQIFKSLTWTFEVKWRGRIS